MKSKNMNQYAIPLDQQKYIVNKIKVFFITDLKGSY